MENPVGWVVFWDIAGDFRQDATSSSEDPCTTRFFVAGPPQNDIWLRVGYPWRRTLG